jgi:serine/threonine-protein kinase
MADAETEARLKKIETTLDRLSARLDTIEAKLGGASQETEVVKVLRQRVETVTSERDSLAQNITRLEAVRAKPTAEQIGQSFAGATVKLREGLGRSFAVADLTVEMKSQLAVDPDGSLRFVLPQPGETVAADTLSTVRFNLRATPAQPPEPDAPLITVPTLVGLSREAALLLLTRAGLKPGTETPQVAGARPGTVLAQSPLPGDEIAPEIAVDLTIATPPPVEVPDLSGMTAEEAGKRLQDAGLVSGKVANAPQGTRGKVGTVASQSAKPGSAVPPGSAIDLLLVPEPPPPPPTVRVPDVVGRTAGEATTKLSGAGLTVGPTKRLASSMPTGTVLAADPGPGSEVPRSAPVALTLAREATIEQLGERIAKRTPADPQPAAAGVRRAAAPVPANRIAEQLRALNLKTPEDLVALSEEPDAVLATKLGLPTPRDAAAARALLRAVLEE